MRERARLLRSIDRSFVSRPGGTFRGCCELRKSCLEVLLEQAAARQWELDRVAASKKKPQSGVMKDQLERKQGVQDKVHTALLCAVDDDAPILERPQP